MFTTLTIYVCLLLVTPKWNIGYPNWICFYFTEYYDTLQPRFIYLPFFGFTRFSQLKSLFGNVYSKRFPTRSLSRIFPMFYSVANVSELQFFGSVYSQEHLLMTVSDKNICDKQFDLLVFPRNLLKFGFNIVIGILQCLYSKCCSSNYFWLSLLIYGNQSISLRGDLVVTYNENCSIGLHIRLPFFSCFILFFDF